MQEATIYSTNYHHYLPSQSFLGCHLLFHSFSPYSYFKGVAPFLWLRCIGIGLIYSRDVALCIVNSSKWKSALRWRACKDEFGERTPLKLLITQMPGKFCCITLYINFFVILTEHCVTRSVEKIVLYILRCIVYRKRLYNITRFSYFYCFNSSYP